jgi:polysaccharide deacetylase family protein (PEP-CTERM system associated)
MTHQPKFPTLAAALRAAPTAGRTRNAMTVDVEDYYQVQAFAAQVDRKDWAAMPSRVERNTDAVLQIFADQGVHATFFTLGWVAERHAALIRRIVAAGHELASHGYAHHRVFEQTPAQFRDDVRRTKKLLEDIGGTAVNGYRAASFSIDQRCLWAFDILAEEGHTYSSSIYPVKHDLYGMPDAPRAPYRPSASGILEIPLTTVRLAGRNLPCSGGGFFRLYPYGVSRWAYGRVNARDQQPGIFYMHPWEIDPEQPRISGAPLRSRLRHFVNLGRMAPRLRRLLRDFTWDRMDRAYPSAAPAHGG